MADARESAQLYAELLANAVDVPGPITDVLAAAAREAGAHLVIGASERNSDASGTSLYNTIIFFDGDGNLLGKHRKLVPTMGERLVWAQGDGSTLQAFDTSLGKLGGLICWENYMPLARFALYAWGTQIYVAPTWGSNQHWLDSISHIAFEGGCYVISCCEVVHATTFPTHTRSRSRWLRRAESGLTSVTA